MLGKVRKQPLDGTPARLNVGELALIGRSLGEVLLLLRDNVAAQLFGSGQLKTTASQHLQLVNAAPEVLGRQTTEAGLLDFLDVPPVHLAGHRNPTATLGSTHTGATQKWRGVHDAAVVVLVNLYAVDVELTAGGVEVDVVVPGRFRRSLHPRHGELRLNLLTGSLPHDSDVSQPSLQRIRTAGRCRVYPSVWVGKACGCAAGRLVQGVLEGQAGFCHAALSLSGAVNLGT